ncbi:hypothetical protein ACPCSK_31465 [Streptomyces griseoincarnatus]
MSGFGAGIRRGVMAGDQFTQIANGLFRDGRLSFKAKGVFGLLSTHREGWRMTVADLARCGRDGEAAAKSGLNELEQHGFLVRERERGQDGTLGVAVYFITDLSGMQNHRSQWLCSRRRAAFRQQFGRRIPLRMFTRTDSSSVVTAGPPSAAPRKVRPKALATGGGGNHDRAVADRRRVPPVLVNNDSAARRAPPGVVYKRCRKS